MTAMAKFLLGDNEGYRPKHGRKHRKTQRATRAALWYLLSRTI